MLEIPRVPIKAKQLVHTTVGLPFPPRLATPAGADALAVCEEEVPSVFASWEDAQNTAKQCSKSA